MVHLLWVPKGLPTLDQSHPQILASTFYSYPYNTVERPCRWPFMALPGRRDSKRRDSDVSINVKMLSLAVLMPNVP